MLIASKLMTNGDLKVPPSYTILIFTLIENFQPEKNAVTRTVGLE